MIQDKQNHGGGGEILSLSGSVAIRGGVNWIDWMKALGMFLIIWGHLSPTNLEDFIYSFNVPSFFVISGFLFKEVDWRTFWHKNLKGLIIPYVLLCISIILFFGAVKLYMGDMDSYYISFSLLACLIGDQDGIGCGFGCQALWFVYTLFLIKVVVNAVKDRWHWQFVIIICCLVAAFFLKLYNIQLFSSYIDVLLSYPFFIMGFYIAKRKLLNVELAQEFIRYKRHKALCIVMLLLSIIALFFIAHCNGQVRMYNADYGNNLILFILDGCIGTALLAVMSLLLGAWDMPKMLKRLLGNMISTHSKGSIITLAWQIFFLLIAKNIIGENRHDDVISFLLALCIYLAFIPIIKFVNAYMPIISGYRR